MAIKIMIKKKKKGEAMILELKEVGAHDPAKHDLLLYITCASLLAII
jgi:hypothetical protein